MPRSALTREKEGRSLTGMTDLALVLALLAAAIVMFAVNRPRMDAVALLMIVLLPFTGVITMSEALAGFSDPNIVLIAALFVIGEGLVRTGVAQRLGDWLDAKAGSSETRLLVLLMLAVGVLGSVMSSTGVVAIFIPIVLRIAQNTGTAPSRLMMPLSFAALISGMMTLVATAPNLVVNSELVRQGAEGFDFFSFTPFGVPLLALGHPLHAVRAPLAPGDGGRRRLGRGASRACATGSSNYQLAGREHRVRVTAVLAASSGATLEELDLRDTPGANMLAIERAARRAARHPLALRPAVLQAGDMLLVDLFAPGRRLEELRNSTPSRRCR